jgi:hypothetical protein
MMARVAVVIPAYSSNDGLGDWAMRTALTWKPHCDDLIISEDGGYHKGLHEIADLYILHEQLWPAKNMNLGWQIALARGADFVAIMDLDAHRVDGSLREACLPGKVTVPSIVQHPETVSIGPMFIVPKEIAGERGFLDPIKGPRLQWFDADYHVRVNDIIIQSRQLKVYHDGGSVTGVHPYIPRPTPTDPDNPDLTREIDPIRHAQRMREEPKYRIKHTP